MSYPNHFLSLTSEYTAMLEAMWTVDFITCTATIDSEIQAYECIVGGGVVMLQAGRVYGGDSSFYYLGDYSLDGETIRMTVHVKRYNNNFKGAIGLDDYQLQLSGPTDAKSFDVSGCANGDVNRQIVVRFTHLAELP